MNNKKFVFYIEITKKCNLKCPFCPSPKANSDASLKYDDFIKIIENIKDYIDLVYLHVLGEPLVHNDFEKIVKYCEKENISLGITTNGTLINRYRELICSVKCLRKINISLQSLIQFTDAKKNNYLENLIDFIQYRNQIENDLPINLRLWNDKTKVSIQNLNKQITDKLNMIISKSKNVRISIDDEFVWPNTENEYNENFSSCLGGKKQFSVLSDGTIGLCCLDYEGKTRLGNILAEKFNDILNSKLYQDVIKCFNNRKPYFEICQKCTFRNRFLKK